MKQIHLRHKEIMRPKQLADYLSISESTLKRLVKDDPTFPEKIVINARCVAFRKSDIQAWIQAQGGEL